MENYADLLGPGLLENYTDLLGPHFVEGALPGPREPAGGGYEDILDMLIAQGSAPDQCVTPGVLVMLMNSTNKTASEILDGAVDTNEMHPLVVVICGLSVFLMIASLIFHVSWMYRSASKEASFKRAEQLEKLIQDLVMHFFPAAAVEGYQFKGMRRSELGARLDFEELGLTLKADGRTVLQGVTGSIGKGKMAAIMGPSGCGKTTFMNTLCGKSTYGRMTGQVCVNGEAASVSRLEHIMGFVPQDDVVHESLTVREQIEFSGKLRNEYTLTRAEINDIVEDVLHVLQIGHIQRSIVGGVERRGISGGQRKRVNIGLELVACPVLLFLDEPTSGLDSTSSLMIVNALKRITDLGMTIIMVIHQPRYSLFKLFDQVLLLGIGGRTVYLGDPEGAISYFEGHGFRRIPEDNPADWLMDVISGEVQRASSASLGREQLVELWRRTPHREAASPTPDRVGERKKRRQTATRHSYEMLNGMVSQEWDLADVHGTGCLTRHELRGLLRSSTGSQVEVATLDDLLATMGARRDSGKADPRALVYKDDFCAFLRAKFQTMMDKFAAGYMEESEESARGPVGSKTQAGALDTRTPPGRCRQFVMISHRRLVQFWRDWVRRVVNISLIVVAAVAFALMQRGTSGQLVEISMCHMGLSMVLGVSVLSTFADRPILWRESSTGISITSLYIARICVSLIDASTLTIVYAFVYWLNVDATCGFHIYLYPCMCLGWAITAWGYLISVAVSPRNSTLLMLVITMILTQVVGRPTLVVDSLLRPTVIHVLSISPTRWSVPMQFVLFTEAAGGQWYGFPPPPSPNCSDLVDEQCWENNCDEARKNALQGYMKQASIQEYHRWAYSLLASNASWRADGTYLIFSGLVLHVISFMWLIRQSPAANILKESICPSLRRGRRFRPAQPHADGEDSDSSSDSSSDTHA